MRFDWYATYTEKLHTQASNDIVNAAKSIPFPAVCADGLLAHLLRAQHDTIRAEVELALRALQESVPFFSTIGFSGAHSGNSRFETTSLGEFNDVSCTLF